MSDVCVIVAERARSEMARRFNGWPARVQVRTEGECGSHIHLLVQGVAIVTSAQWLAITPRGYVSIGAEVDALTDAEVWFVPESEIVGGEA